MDSSGQRRGERDGSSAWRSRQRRLRSWWRHEQQSIAMALAAAQHHSAPKSAGPVSHNVPRNQNTAREETEFYAMSEDSDVVGGGRPPSLVEVRPQERVQPHTMEHIVDFVSCAPLVQTLDATVPQTVEQLQDVLQFFDRLSTVPEPAIEVPKIFTEDVPMRSVLRATQLAEQLVEVPTIISNPLLLLLQALLEHKQRTVEQNVDISVVGGGGAGGGLSGFLPGQNYSMTAEQIVDNPVPQDLQGFSSGQGSTAFSEQIPELPGPAASSSDSPGQAAAGFFFSHFSPPEKKCEDPARPGVGIGCRVELMDAVSLGSPWWHNMECGVFFVAERQEWCFLVSTSGLPSYPVLRASAGANCAWPPVSHGGLWKNFLFYVPLSRCSHLEIWTLPLPPHLSVLRCLGVACGVRRIFGTRALLGSTVVTLFTGGFGRISHIFYVR